MKNVDSKSHVRGGSVYFSVNQMYIGDMIVSEKINQKLEKLPVAMQLEILDFVEFIAQKAERQNAEIEDAQWSEFSLNQAMKGLEDEETPEYTEADLVEKWQ